MLEALQRLLVPTCLMYLEVRQPAQRKSLCQAHACLQPMKQRIPGLMPSASPPVLWQQAVGGQVCQGSFLAGCLGLHLDLHPVPQAGTSRLGSIVNALQQVCMLQFWCSLDGLGCKTAARATCVAALRGGFAATFGARFSASESCVTG